MYHSHLLINVGDNPDWPDWNICRRWLRNLYRVHQRLCMAFPSAAPKREDWPARQNASVTEVFPTRLGVSSFHSRISIELHAALRRRIIRTQPFLPVLCPPWESA